MRHPESFPAAEEQPAEPPPAEQPKDEFERYMESRKLGYWGRLKYDFFQAIRKDHSFQAVVVLMALQAGSLTWHTAEKAAELDRIGKKEKAVAAEMAELQTLAEKHEKIKKLFGEDPTGIGARLSHVEQGQGEAARERREFFFFDPTSEIRPWESTPAEADDMEPTPQIETGALVASGGVHVEKGELASVLRETFPKGWVDGEVSSIEQKDEERPRDERYGLSDEWETVGVCERGDDGRDRIILYRPSTQQYLYYLINDTMAHELGHANDWKSDNEMTQEERADLLLAIADRLYDDDRHQSRYVESITNKDPQRERYLKATEYWAEICSAYFRDPEELHIADYALVAGHVQRTDPDFNPPEQERARWRFIDEKYQATQ